MLTQSETFFDRIRLAANPVADSRNVVVSGNARFTLLTSRLVRLEWAESGQFEDRATFAFPQRQGEPVLFSRTATDAGLVITTEHLTLTYREDGRPFNEGNLSICFQIGGKDATWTPGMAPSGNLRGTRRTLDQCAGEADLQLGLLSRDGWSLFDDSGAVVWDKDQTWVEARSAEHLQDWYFFGYGHDYKALLREYIQFGGPIPLPPRYVLGAWWSRFWAYSDRDLMNLVGDFQSRDLPLDVLVVDMDWHTKDAWTGYTWNKDLFPDPEGFLSWVHSQNLFVTLNLHPAQGVQKHEAAYPAFAERIGHDVSAGAAIPFRCADKTFIQPYFELLHHPMEEQGVDFWWLDWQQGTTTEMRNLDPLPWLNHLHFQDSARRGSRPMLYSRWGGLGNHRYPIGFSGDAYATWEALAFQTYFTATAANVCYGWWSHDIGGHFGPTEPELYARWVQFGAVSPCLRLHSTNDPLAERRPWTFPEPVYAAAKAAFQFRYRMFPYFYSANRHASLQGLSLCTPMYYDYPAAEDAYLTRNQYLLGDQMMAAPIGSPADPETGLATYDVWIPDGTWYDFWTAETFTGPRWLRRTADLNTIPLYVKAGGIVPMAENLRQTRMFDGSRVLLTVFPGADGQFGLYEDDGLTTAYRQGDFETTAIQTRTIGDTFELTIAAAQGHAPCLGDQRSFELRVRAVRHPAQVTVNGAAYADWRYEAESGDLVIALNDVSRTAEQTIIVKFDGRALPEPTVKPVVEPFVHAVDYLTYPEAREQLGAILIAPPSDGSPFDVEVTWTLFKFGNVTTSEPDIRRDCRTPQVFESPFRDEGVCTPFRWTANATITWQGGVVRTEHHSPNAYPMVSRWDVGIYNPEKEPVNLADVRSGKTSLNWQTFAQPPEASANLKQPFRVILLEEDAARVRSGEPLEAVFRTTISRQQAQDAVLYVPCVGSVGCTLNGVELTEIESMVGPTLEPVFYSWYPTSKHYYAVTLPEGDSELVIFSTPDMPSGFWGVAAAVLDPSGAILT